ncbi:hypothetical protein D3C87_1382070 [compost metagenome]
MFFQRLPQHPQHLTVVQMKRPFCDDGLRLREHLNWDDCFERSIPSNPLFRWVAHMLDLQLERRSVVDVMAYVFFVGENLMNGAPRPLNSRIGGQAFTIENRSDKPL